MINFAASNILVSKTCSCQDILHCTCPEPCSCQDVLHCTCPKERRKYEVKLSDFDSIKETKASRAAKKLPSVECSRKSQEQLKKVMGTPAMRAPEVISMWLMQICMRN